MANSATPLAVELRGVAKRFGACVANRDVRLAVRSGTIHALVGENGAGKSTCMKVLYGLYPPDEGQVVVRGEACVFRSPHDAIAKGLGMVHQHFMLAEPYTGLDNILLGAEPAKLGFGWLPQALRPIDRAGALAKLEGLAKAYRFPVDLLKPAGRLPVGVQQRLEILKLLYRDVDILILDEPTAVLTPGEVEEFFANLRRLKGEGKTIIIITHKLREVIAIADDVTVIRKGEVVGAMPVKDATEASLAALMVGRAVNLTVAPPPLPKLGGPGLKLVGVTLKARGAPKPLLEGLTFEVARGEIVGICGVEGNGQSELLELVGEPRPHFVGTLRRPLVATGQIEVLGQDVRALRARQLRRLGVGLVPEDRHRQGLILSFDLALNFLLGMQRTAEFCRFGFLRFTALGRRLKAAMERFDVRPAVPAALAASLSGGNQQKLVIARELDLAPSLFVCAQPTRGVDVGSIEFIHQQILATRARGAAVLLVSSSLEEVLALSDRILVFYEGRIAKSFQRGEASEATLGRFMGGAHD